jgi:hypothetical protein
MIWAAPPKIRAEVSQTYPASEAGIKPAFTKLRRKVVRAKQLRPRGPGSAGVKDSNPAISTRVASFCISKPPFFLSIFLSEKDLYFASGT